MLVAGLLLIPVGCYSQATSEMSKSEKLARIDSMAGRFQGKFSDVPGIDAATLRDRLAAGTVVLVDVRGEDERAVSQIAGAISADEFERRADQLAGSEVVTYCTIGYRSSAYAQDLRRQGWDASNFDGSILAWTHAGGDLVDANGQPTRRVHVYGERWNLAADGYETVW